jgi:hypothetical protein
MNKVNRKTRIYWCCVRCVCIIINYKNYHIGFYLQHHIKLYHSNNHLFEYIDIVIYIITLLLNIVYFRYPDGHCRLYTYDLVMIYYFILWSLLAILLHFMFESSKESIIKYEYNGIPK